MKAKFLITCCALAASCLAAAAEPAQEGMTVVRDPQTGKLRAPTAAELRALRGGVRQPQMVAEPVKSKVRADGTRSIDLGERGLIYSVMKRNDDGSLTSHCVMGADAASQALEKRQEARHEQH